MSRIYSPGNTAKQWIAEQIIHNASQSIRVLDLACGRAWIWKDVLTDYPSISVVGLDTDKKAIQKGKRGYDGYLNIDLRVFDAQKSIQDSSFDVVTAFSAMEHVVNHEAFLKTVWNALSSGGVAFLNYDAGHFRSRNLKERMMVPISQLLAKIGIEGPYMKQVNDREFVALARKQGFEVKMIRKHNIMQIKGFMKGAEGDAIRSWISFEEDLGRQYAPKDLDALMLSTTVVLQKP